MSAGPIEQWRDSWLPPKVSTNPRTATHFVRLVEALCGSRLGTNYTTERAAVSCSNCIAALTADDTEGQNS